MRIEVPIFKRCCFCLPLRYGIITFGYLNMLFSIFNIGLELCFGQCTIHENSMTVYKGVMMHVRTWLPITLYTIEFIFNLILVVGAHLKKAILLQVFYYYGITTTLATLTSLVFTRYSHWGDQHWSEQLVEAALVFAGFVMTCYILLLVRAELKKLKQQDQNYLMTELPTIRSSEE